MTTTPTPRRSRRARSTTPTTVGRYRVDPTPDPRHAVGEMYEAGRIGDMHAVLRDGQGTGGYVIHRPVDLGYGDPGWYAGVAWSHDHEHGPYPDLQAASHAVAVDGVLDYRLTNGYEPREVPVPAQRHPQTGQVRKLIDEALRQHSVTVDDDEALEAAAAAVLAYLAR